MSASLTYDRLFCNRICWWHSPPPFVQLRYDRISLFPLFFIMRMFADLVLTLTPIWALLLLLLLYKNVLCAFPWPINSYPFFLFYFFGDTEMAQKMVRVETFWRVAWTVFPWILHRSNMSQVKRQNRFGSMWTGIHTYVILRNKHNLKMVFFFFGMWITGGFRADDWK